MSYCDKCFQCGTQMEFRHDRKNKALKWVHVFYCPRCDEFRWTPIPPEEEEEEDPVLDFDEEVYDE